MKLTPRKKPLIEFINSYVLKNGYSPTITEIAKHLNLAISTVHQHIKELEEGGYIKKEKNLSRGIEVAILETMVSIPFLGTIAAGEPIEVIERRETIAIPKSKLPKSGNVYALHVQGDSMIDEGVRNGDTILVREQNTAENGERVVALLNGNEATLKTFYKEKGHIRLQPANKNYQPIII